MKLNSSAAALAAVLLLAGGACNRTPTRIEPPEMEPAEVARLAVELYDRDGDELISAQEAEAAPALAYSLAQPGLLDTSGDGQISAAEIVERVRTWQKSQAGLVPVRCLVLLDGEPLTGASVTYEPAEFLPEAVKPAFGATDELGEARMSLRPEDRPDPNAPSGVQLGWYRVRVSKVVDGDEIIPAYFNAQTVLGQEVSFQDPGLQSQSGIVHRLTTR
jgi:hypothetical protein